jgi:hypothetical protein
MKLLILQYLLGPNILLIILFSDNSQTMKFVEQL